MVTTMPLQPGLIGKTTGTFSGIRLIQCIADGSLKLKYPNDASKDETIAVTAGADYFIEIFNAVEVVSGTFNLAR